MKRYSTRSMIQNYGQCSRNGSKLESWIKVSSKKQHRVRHRGESLHFLQSCQHAGRVFDAHSTATTAPRLWGRVSRGPTPAQAGSGEPDATGARRAAWLVDHTKPAELWRCVSPLSRAE